MPTRCSAAFFTILITILMGTLLMRLTRLLPKLGVKRALALEQEELDFDMLNFETPPLSMIESFVTPLSALLQPEATGLDRVPTDCPCLYVMNHALMGLDMGPFLAMLYREKASCPEPLATTCTSRSPTES